MWLLFWKHGALLCYPDKYNDYNMIALMVPEQYIRLDTFYYNHLSVWLKTNYHQLIGWLCNKPWPDSMMEKINRTLRWDYVNI